MNDTPRNEHPGVGKRNEEAPADGTLGGYLRHHNRPPAFEGNDGYSYTVSVEVERTPNLRAPFSGYLIFPRWADTGAGIIGHLETPLLLDGASLEEVTAGLEAITLPELNDLLEQAILRRQRENE
jgi:hypothetical protein